MKKFAASFVGVLVLATASAPAFAQDDSPSEEAPPAEKTAEEEDGSAPEDQPGASETEEADEEGEPDDEEPSAGEESEEAPPREEGAEESEEGEDEPLPSAQEAVEKAADTGEAETEKGAEQPADETGEEEAESEQAELPEADAEKPFGESPIADLADDEEFVPLEDIDEGGLEQIIPAKVYPRMEWAGTFRARTAAAINWDLDTEGTSAILPPTESFTPQGNPVDPERDTHWDTNLRLKLDPTLHITEQLRVHTELDLLDNLNFGSLPANRLADDPVTPDLSTRTGSSSQLSPREREFFDNAIQINELYGQVETLLGQLTVGRMDDDWGLGIFANAGDCPDCDYGSHVDRFKFQTKVWELHAFATLDFPDEGLASRVPFRNNGQPFDLAQIDDVDQYNFGVFRRPVNREERELQGKTLLDDQLPVFNGGVFYRYRKQEGRYTPLYSGSGFDPTEPRDLIYRGERVHIVDLWAQFLYQPDFDTRIRVELEGITALGSVDNATDLAVGLPEEAGDDPINCFDEDQFSANEGSCTTNSEGDRTDRNIQQFGLALESEFQLDSPVTFGFDGGFASGGATPNWGSSGGPDLEFYRFNPDYHVDKIMFRNVIGTVTNAYYFNPWAMVRFLDSSSRHMELQIDGVASRAFNLEGTPSGSDPWLGLEFDGSVRYVNLELFTAALEGGILFPFEGLAAMPGRPRYLQYGANPEEFNGELSARIAWTVGAKFFWNF
jgi:uncharacterized protein (TIGR04551 family)